MNHLRRITALAALAFVAGASCDDPPRVPYIKPELAHWTRPYVGVEGMVLHVFETGLVRFPEVVLRQGGSPTSKRSLPAVAYVLEHPTEGLVVIGTGLGAEPAPIVPPGGGLLAGLMTGDAIASRPLPEQMNDAGLELEKVRWVLLPTLQPQHAGSVEAFAAAKVVIARAERHHALRAPAVYRLADFDDVNTWHYLDFEGQGLGTFARAADLFGDGSVMAIDAAGWTSGATIYLVRFAARPVLLAAGLAEIQEHARYAAKPTAAHDFAGWWQHIWELKRFADLAPELLIVPGAVPAVLAEVGAPSVVFHAAPEVEEPVVKATPDAMRRFLP